LKKLLILIPLAILMAFLLPSCGEPPPLSNAWTEASLQIKSRSELVILAFTDIHLLNPKKKQDALPLAEKTINCISALAKKHKPDLIIIDGDIFCSQKDESPCLFLRTAMDKIGLPWAIVWGNHDIPGMSSFEKVLSQDPLCLFKSCNPERNYSIRISGTPDGKTLCRLFMMNSRVGGLTQKSLDWFNDELANTAKDGDAIKIAFFHIPLPQFAELWASGHAVGVNTNGISSEKTPKSVFPALKGGGISAVFCGHDHNNDFYGDWDGVRLQCLKCRIKDGAYGQGATLIKISFAEKSCKTETLEYNEP